MRGQHRYDVAALPGAEAEQPDGSGRGAVQREGRTLIPVKLYFNERGLAKLEVALAKGKKAHDKREASAERDWQRDKARLMREKG